MSRPIRIVFSLEHACSNIAPLFGQDEAKAGDAMSF